MLLNHRVLRIAGFSRIVVTLATVALVGCSGDDPATNIDETSESAAASESSADPKAPEPKTPEPATTESDATPTTPAQEVTLSVVRPEEPVEEFPEETFQTVDVEPEPSTIATVAAVEPEIEPAAESPSLDEMLADLEIPAAWLNEVETTYGTSHPWKEARLEIRRLLGLGQPETHRQAIKLTWLYLQKDDIGDGHEYPMYMFLGGEPLWAVKAFEWYIAKHDSKAPIYGLMGLAPLYVRYGEYEKAKALLDQAMDNLPDPPWKIMRKADVFDAYGDLYAAWGKPDEAKRYYVQAIEWYPKAKPPYGGHLCPRRAAKVQSKLDLLTFRSLDTANLRDGQYQDRSLGYAGDIHVTLVVKDGKVADIKLKHEEKIDQNACTLIPQRIVESQSLLVDGVSGATVTKDAIVDGAYRCLKRAGLR